MAKKKKGKVIQMLSPENYIRQKARNLPIHECWVNSDWKITKQVNVIISRKHSNGNFTIGFFLVDLLCLGVKDTHLQFNTYEGEYTSLLEMTEEEMEIEKIDYTLAHNIIFAGVEFAAEYGFKPCKDFTSTMQYFLEKDTEDIEIIEIECGENNQPLYVSSPFDNEIETPRVLAQLEKTAGKGNFAFIDDDDGDDYFFDEGNEWDDDLDDDFYSEKEQEQKERFGKLSHSEKIKYFKSLLSSLDDLTDEENDDLAFLNSAIIVKYIDFDIILSIYDKLASKINRLERTDRFSDKLLGIKYITKEFDRKQWAAKFEKTYYHALQNKKSTKKEIRILQKEMPENPAVAFLELTWLQATESKEYNKQLAVYHEKFHNYPLIAIHWEITQQFTHKQKTTNSLFEKGPAHYFPNRKTWHELEIYAYFFLLISSAIVERDNTRLMVLDMLIHETQLSEFEETLLTNLIIMAKTDFILNL